MPVTATMFTSRKLVLTSGDATMLSVIHAEPEMHWQPAEVGEYPLADLANGARVLRNWIAEGLPTSISEVLPPREAALMLSLSREQHSLSFSYHLGGPWEMDADLKRETVAVRAFAGGVTSVEDAVGFASALTLALNWAQNKPVVQRPW